MKTTNLLSLVAVAAYLLGFPGICALQAQEVTGWTSLEFDQSSGKVYGYAETDLDYGATSYYQACLYTSMSDLTSGAGLGSQRVCAPTTGSNYVEANLSGTGTFGHTYYAYSQHYVQFWYRNGYGYFEDYYNFLSWPSSAYAGFDWEGQYDWFGPGPNTSDPNEQADLAETDSDAELVATGPCHDSRDNLIQEYKTYQVNLWPTCTNFNTSAHSTYFSNAQLTVNESPAYGWSLLVQEMLRCIDLWRASYGPITINSAYRNPAHNAAIGGAANSRHMHGDAVDFNNPTKDTNGRNKILGSTTDYPDNPDYIEPTYGPCKLNCVHVDWRLHAQIYAQ